MSDDDFVHPITDRGIRYETREETRRKFARAGIVPIEYEDVADEGEEVKSDEKDRDVNLPTGGG